jgi:hypothetical protein
VISISRAVDKVTRDRHDAPFVVRFVTADGEDEMLTAGVVDASGTWLTPNPLGANGTPALGESQVRGRLHYGIPDVLGADRSRHAGRTTAVVGSGHSAANSVLALLALRQQSPTTEVHWLIRGITLRALTPLIDPNAHSCSTVRPHSYQALTHSEVGFFTAGAKSYGRAPTFLMATGYEQVRSIAAHLAVTKSARSECSGYCRRAGLAAWATRPSTPADAGVLVGAGCCG